MSTQATCVVAVVNLTLPFEYIAKMQGACRVGNPVNLQPSYASGPDSATVIHVPFKEGNHLGVEPGQARILIGGWKWGTDDQNISHFNTRMVVKCSGYIPNRRADEQLPPHDKYGTNAQTGGQPQFVPFPVAHAAYYKGIKNLLDNMKTVQVCLDFAR